jgi:hypothetical protein
MKLLRDISLTTFPNLVTSVLWFVKIYFVDFVLTDKIIRQPSATRIKAIPIQPRVGLGGKGTPLLSPPRKPKIAGKTPRNTPIIVRMKDTLISPFCVTHSMFSSGSKCNQILHHVASILCGPY